MDVDDDDAAAGTGAPGGTGALSEGEPTPAHDPSQRVLHAAFAEQQVPAPLLPLHTTSVQPDPITTCGYTPINRTHTTPLSRRTFSMPPAST